MKIFNLPDLGEGLPDAEIVEWLVAEGDAVTLDQPMVSMETAKAVVEVPSPYTGVITKLYGKAGDVIETGKPLAGFTVEGESAAPQAEKKAEAPKTDPAPEPAAKAAEPEPTAARADTGTVVGAMETSDAVVAQSYSTVGGVKVSPAVRALARKLKVDLAGITPTGADGVVTRADVEAVAKNPAAARSAPPAPAARPAAPARPATPQASAAPPSGEWEPIRGTRRSMARIMSEAHAQVVATTLMDDADIHKWGHTQDVSVRLLRSLWAGAQAEPGLNAWYDGAQGIRMVHKTMHVGMAVDTPDGLFAVALRNVHSSDGAQLREALNRLKENTRSSSIPPEDLKDYTIMLSNFGVFAGRYATPIINPPCVCIVAAGKLRHEATPVLGGFEVHRVIPLSLTFEHRIVTGGEAARFLKAMIEDLARPE
jgi:pyruvate dehydrogenase E2 component (dihydrolipoamide acetyltransferase)